MLKQYSEMWINVYIQRFGYSDINKAKLGENMPHVEAQIYISGIWTQGSKWAHENMINQKSWNALEKSLKFNFFGKANHNPRDRKITFFFIKDY